MKSWLALAVVAAAVPVALAAVPEDVPKIKEVMGKLHKGAKSQQKALEAQVKAQPTDWEAIGKTTKDFVILGASLAKNDPPKGDKESWKKLADKYFADAKAIDDAAAAKDMDKLKAAQKSMGGSCKTCHTAHRPPAN